MVNNDTRIYTTQQYVYHMIQLPTIHMFVFYDTTTYHILIML